MSAEATVESIINNAIDKSTDLLEQAKGYADDAQVAAAGFVSFDPPGLGSWESAKLPDFTPDEDLSGLFKAEYDTAYARYIDLLSQKLAEFFTSYFPDFSTNMRAAEQWLVSAIQNGGTGLKPDIENAIWERGRAKELIEANRMEQEIIAGYAARGWSLPPGAMLAKIQEVQQAASDKISTHARDVAIKQAEIELENTRFAVEQALTHRRAVIIAALEYMKAWMLATDAALKEASAIVNAKGDLLRNAAVYYDALLRSENIRKERAFKVADMNMQAGEIATRAFVDIIRNRSNAAVALAESTGHAASAALTSLNTMAQVANVTNN